MPDPVDRKLDGAIDDVDGIDGTKIRDEVERASFDDDARAAPVAAQSLHREFQLAVEVLGGRWIGERFRLLQPLVRLRLVNVVAVRREKVRNQRALATAMRSDNRDSQACRITRMKSGRPMPGEYGAHAEAD